MSATLSAIFSAIAALGGLGVLFAIALAVAGKVFAVEEDPRLSLLVDALPGANCGACGFAGCSAYAQAVLNKTTVIGTCPVGGEACTEAMGIIMGVAVDAMATRQIALVRCTGHGQAHLRYEYDGIQDCLAASRLPGGGYLSCKDGCLGLGTCVSACPFGAIHVKNHVAVVDPDLCKGCLKCVDICPHSVITIVPADSHVTILCSNTDKGTVVRQVCDIGCIGCGICAKICPEDAITVGKHLATIDYTKCTGCRTCVEKCPRKLIQ